MDASYLDATTIRLTLAKKETLATLQGPGTFTITARPGLAVYDALIEAKVEIAPAPRSATGYALWSALTRAQIAKLDAKDAGRLQARGSDPIPETNPVIARLAGQAGISVSAWFDLAQA